jgi:hypothetical protein
MIGIYGVLRGGGTTARIGMGTRTYGVLLSVSILRIPSMWYHMGVLHIGYYITTYRRIDMSFYIVGIYRCLLFDIFGRKH